MHSTYPNFRSRLGLRESKTEKGYLRQPASFPCNIHLYDDTPPPPGIRLLVGKSNVNLLRCAAAAGEWKDLYSTRIILTCTYNNNDVRIIEKKNNNKERKKTVLGNRKFVTHTFPDDIVYRQHQYIKRYYNPYTILMYIRVFVCVYVCVFWT